MFQKRWERVRELIRGILSAHLTPLSIGQAVALGVFIGCLPIYGIHLGVCIVLARWLKLNEVVVYAGANITNPVFAPFIIAIEIAIGEYLRFGNINNLDWDEFQHTSLWTMLKHTPDLLWSCTLGSVLLGLVLGPALGGLAWMVARARQRREQQEPV